MLQIRYRSEKGDEQECPPTGRHLAVIQRACQQLATCTSVDEIKQIRDKAEALRQYAKNARASLELLNRAAELKLRAERRAGELLRAMRLRGGDRVSESSSSRLTLAQLQISESQSARWQKLAAIPDVDFSKFLALAHRDGVELSTAALLRIAATRLRHRDNDGVPTDAGSSHTPPALGMDKSSPEELVAELVSHCRLLNAILTPLYNGAKPPRIRPSHRRHLRYLVRQSMLLLADLRQCLRPREGNEPYADGPGTRSPVPTDRAALRGRDRETA
jgi:hypothetical protein